MKTININASLLAEITSYLNSGIEVEEEKEYNQVVSLEIISKERFTMLKGSFKQEVSEVMFAVNELPVPKFTLGRNILGEIITVRMFTYAQPKGHRVELFYDEYHLC